ncbi:MAG: protein kinase [Myxococcales bacterium]|nr:protein kinase [Myxococcales bacterium]
MDGMTPDAAARRASQDAATIADGPPKARAEEVRPPAEAADRIGRFTILELVGAGGMGLVYAAYDPELDRKVAVKLVRSDEGSAGGEGSDGRSRLLREAQALARVAHPNVVAIHDVGVHEGQVFIAMEYVTGVDLRLWLEERPRSWREILEVYLQAGDGLAAVHEAGLVHRDFKPDNVLVGDDGRARVADFGLVGMSHEPSRWRPESAPGGELRLTLTGAFMGTPPYMSPEQHRGEDVGPASDVFGFCVALHEALHGVRPFAGRTPAAILEEVMARAPRRSERGAEAPAWLRAIVERGLDPDPAIRWSSMPALLAALRRDPEVRRRQRLRTAALVALGLVLALVVVALVDAGAAAWRRAEAERAAAERWGIAAERIAALRASSQVAAADEVFAAFIAADEQRGTRAIAAAWRWRAARARGEGDVDGARRALARAYGEAIDPEGEAAALHGLSDLFYETWSFDRLIAVVERARDLGEGRGAALDPAIARPAIAATIAQRDLRGAAAAIDGLGADAPADLAGWRPLLTHLAGARASAHAPGRIHAPPGDALVLLDADTLTIVERRPELPTRRAIALGERYSAPPWWVGGDPGGTRWLIAWRDIGGTRAELSLLEVDDAGARVRERWEDGMPLAAVGGDLGDGIWRVFVGIGPFARRIVELRRGEDGAWSRGDAHPPTSAAYSDVGALLVDDLDGDRRPELIAAAGPWNAYDLRVLRPDAGGLAMIARRRLGHVGALAGLDDPAGRLLLALKTDHYPNPDVFPPGQPTGDPAGIHALRLGGGGLVEVGLLPAPRPLGAAAPLPLAGLLVGDLDGDGVGEIVTSTGGGQAEPLLIIHRMSEETPSPLVLRGLKPLAIAELDDDPAAELLVIDAASEALWVLGAGGDALPPPTAAAAPPPAPTSADPALARVQRRAEELVAMGLGDEAAGLLAGSAELAVDAADRAALLRRAAELHEAGDAIDAAIDAYRRLAAVPGGGVDGLRGAARCQRRAGELADALASLDALLDRDALAADLRAQVREERDTLARLVRPTRQVHLSFDAPLDRRWRIDDAIGVRRDPIAARLHVDLFGDGPPLARLPLRADGDAIALRVELALTRLEWGSGLIVGLRRAGDPGARPLVGVGIEGAGGRNALAHLLHCVTSDEGRHRSFGNVEVADATTPVRGVLEIAVQGDVAVCSWTSADGPTKRSIQPLLGRLGRGDVELVLAPASPGADTHAWSSVEIAAIDVSGAELSPETADDDEAPLAATRRWQAEDGLAPAIAAYRSLEIAPADRVALALALESLGRWGEAELELAAALASDDPAALDALGRALRLRTHALSILLADQPSEALAATILRMWRTPAVMNPDDVMVASIGELLDRDAAWHLAEPSASLTRLWLLHTRGRAWLRRGVDERARRDLLAALAEAPHVARSPDAEDLVGRATAAIQQDLTILAARAGATDEALAHAAAALAESGAPETVADRLWVRPELAPLQGDPRWRALLGR